MKKNWEIFLIFFKIGLLTFGGGYAMISHLKEEIVEKKKWIEEDQMLNMIAISESTPGPIAINIATFVGYRQNKILGSFLATLGIVLPSLIIIFAISLVLDSFMQYKYVVAAFSGIKVCVAFLIIKTGIEMFIKMEKSIFSVSIFLLIFLITIIFEIFSITFSSILFIIVGAAFGLFYPLFIKQAKEELK